ncbi:MULTISPECIES: DUF805 domain-containing protein [unclassified Streptomyces]|uniref:DUF805 domain-containing protein n=1 Tax=unclassified Streptomyces TaxID=2593676 RepID=UPI0006F1CB34|nr:MULTISPECIES: DUF805 domain-containing protein [unclassified Streptomyces]KQX49977.1 hypothetical protein ASD33_15190 [Streptomyces sp. Root1304]KRA79980.1 hypothetical protein ASE09_17720 [Streptomyces sp. Root66D1]
MNWYIDVLKKYAVFSGRARRQEFWMFELINFIIAIVIGVIGTALDFSLLSVLYSLAIFLPSLAVTVRRLHDTGRSGWWVLIALVPLVGFIVLIVFAATEGDQHQNAHGPNPKLAPAY